MNETKLTVDELLEAAGVPDSVEVHEIDWRDGGLWIKYERQYDH